MPRGLQQRDNLGRRRGAISIGKSQPAHVWQGDPTETALTDLATSLPDYAIEAIREALPAFDKQIKGFSRPDAVLTGVETRTSSPIRITRDDQTFQSLNIKGLYPAGEGAGYAGGILSAAIDGIKVAEAVALSLAAQ